ncbi:MAG: Rieske 2Fe-2S domain-containing protein [Gammaproteobacteria bacterium]|nr:Rieske 2Fe-2S domain-containing protein [Gammaproteobacteria bacterium]
MTDNPKHTVTIIPTMKYHDAPAAIEWLCDAFGFEKLLVVPGENGTIAHAQLTFGKGMIMLGSAVDNEFGKLQKTPRDVGGIGTQSPYITVADADAHYRRAVAAGAEIVADIEDQDHGGRAYSCRDPEGHLWNFGTYDPWLLEHVWKTRSNTMDYPNLETLVDSVCARASDSVGAAMSLDPACYDSAALYELECQRIFLREWLCVGHVDQFPGPGDYRCVDLIGEPLVVVHGQDGEIRVLSRVCRHRSVEVVAGAGNITRFVCPYHAWTYALDGQLVAAPHMQNSERFQLSDICLPEFRTEMWEGFVFVNFDADAKPLGERLSGLTELVKRYRVNDMRTVHEKQYDCEWDWKLMVDNFVEAYHHMGSHRETVEPYYPAKGAVSEPFRPEYGVVHMPRNRKAFEEDDEYLPTIDGLNEDERNRLSVITIYPTHLIALTDHALYWLQVLPKAAGRMVLRACLCVPPETVARQDLKELVKEYFDDFLEVNKEDMEVCAAVQRGLRSRFAQSGRLSHLEEPLTHFYRYLALQLGRQNSAQSLRLGRRQRAR